MWPCFPLTKTRHSLEFKLASFCCTYWSVIWKEFIIILCNTFAEDDPGKMYHVYDLMDCFKLSNSITQIEPKKSFFPVTLLFLTVVFTASQAKANGLQSCVVIIRVMRDLCTRVPAFIPLNSWVGWDYCVIALGHCMATWCFYIWVASAVSHSTALLVRYYYFHSNRIHISSPPCSILYYQPMFFTAVTFHLFLFET